MAGETAANSDRSSNLGHPPVWREILVQIQNGRPISVSQVRLARCALSVSESSRNVTTTLGSDSGGRLTAMLRMGHDTVHQFNAGKW